LDEENNAEKKNPYENPKPKGHLTFRQKLLRWLGRYSLLIIVGLAALSITFLHFKGRYLLKVLQGTPLPTFFLEKIIVPKQLPDKTQVYEEALKQEEKQLRQKHSLHNKPVKPHWQVSPVTGNTKTIVQMQVQDTSIIKSKPLTYTDTVELAKPQIVKKSKKGKRKPRLSKPASSRQTIATKKEADIDFFQPVKISSLSPESNFVPCSVHGGQEVSNNQMLTLRLAKDLMVNGQKIPAGTLVYGVVRLAQNRVQVSISRISHYAVNYRVHDHTYHEGVLLDETQNAWKDATRETAYRQGQRSVRDLPIDVAAELGRSILQHSKRKQATVFLPDGYPLYLVNQQQSTP
jgi:hypothetical protein